MKCINKKNILTGLFLCSALNFMACQKVTFEAKYDIEQSLLNYDVAETFAENLCVINTTNLINETVNSTLSQAGGLFNVADKQVVYAQNIHERLHPASTTKILTAMIALKYGNLEDVITVSKNAITLEAGSSIAGFNEGDKITLEQAIYGLMLCSGNDAAVAIAEHMFGSIEAFAEKMNQEALQLGATNSHFTNPHGLTDEQHYTTAYDLYLIFNEVMKNEKFIEILKTINYTTTYQDKDGKSVEKLWSTTNLYLKGDKQVPEGITVLGGKTGTTAAAGSCLILLSNDLDLNPYISIVLKSQDRTTLYTNMTELLEQIMK